MRLAPIESRMSQIPSNRMQRAAARRSISSDQTTQHHTKDPTAHKPSAIWTGLSQTMLYRSGRVSSAPAKRTPVAGMRPAERRHGPTTSHTLRVRAIDSAAVILSRTTLDLEEAAVLAKDRSERRTFFPQHVQPLWTLDPKCPRHDRSRLKRARLSPRILAASARSLETQRSFSAMQRRFHRSLSTHAHC